MLENLWSLLGMLLTVVLVLALAWAVTRWLASYGAPAAVRLSPGMEKFRVLGQLPLGRSERLVLVRVQDRCYVLGVTEHQITVLRELEADEAKEWLDISAPPIGFPDVLRDALERFGTDRRKRK